MPILGQGRPVSTRRASARLAVFIAVLATFAAACPRALAADLNVRVRFAWGSGGQSPQKWHGRISVAGGTLEALQPLGLEADEAAALRLDNNEVIVAPLVRRPFDSFDVTIRADSTATVRIVLQSAAATTPNVINVPLAELIGDPYRAPLDDFGSNLLVHRAPGDKLRVKIPRPQLVFQPNESFELSIEPDLKTDAAKSPVTIDARLYASGSSTELWQTSKPYDPAATDPIPLQLNVPAVEGVYRLKLVAHHPDSLTDRLVPWEKTPAVAARDIELVVIDPARRLPRLTNQWELVSTIDPANTSWWQRIPQWTQFDKLPAFSTPRPLGNAKPAPLAGVAPNMVELPLASSLPDEPSWQAYLLPVRRVGEPHAIEIEVPRSVSQHMAISIVEPDAAGLVHSFGRDCGVYSDEHVVQSSGEGAAAVEIHRIVFWPRTRSPAMLLANRSGKHAVQYGKIRLLHRVVEDAPADSAAGSQPTEKPARLVAAYISAPRFAKTLGAAEELDATSGLSVDGWATFLQGANRLAQELCASGYNAAVISIAADGGSLAPIESLGSSPRYDTGPFGSTGADPMRKDILEVLLRIFDREGLRLIPAIQLATPLPRLEAYEPASTHTAGELASAGGEPPSDAPSTLRCIGPDGRTWLERNPIESAAAPHYNLLNPAVQSEIVAIADQLLERYGQHQSLAGVALQVAGNGYGVLPGLSWGLDDATAGRFAAETKIELPTDGSDRFQKRANLLLGAQLDAWKNWRREQVTKFYAEVANRVSRDRKELELVLCTEDLFNGAAAEERLRQAVAGRASLNNVLDELGIDVRQLAATPGVAVLRSRRQAADESVDLRALDLRVNGAPELDQAFGAQPRGGELVYHASSRLRLPSFDAQSPFGADRTYLALNSPSVPTGDAALQSLATALASRDFLILANGAEVLPLVENDKHAAALRAFQELPLDSSDVKTERREPVTLRVYRERESTTICLVNESPWPVTVSLPLEATAEVIWRQLGSEPRANSAAPATAAEPAATGALPAGAQKWATTLPPYGIQARRFSSRTMRIGAFAPQVAQEAQAELTRRVAAIEERLSSLNIERTFNELQNPQFELVGNDGRLLGWQPRVGKAGAVEVAAGGAMPGAAAQGGHSVHLRSEDALGVAVQSHLFPIPPTGQLLVRAKVRVAELKPEARLYAWVEYQSAGVMRTPTPMKLGGNDTLDGAWKDIEFAIDDLPMTSAGQMRIQFHLVGGGEAWLDDVRLYDLRFAKDQQTELGKRLYAAKTALEEGQLMDCQRLVDGYLPRRLVEQVPTISLAARPADPAPTASVTDRQQKNFTDRVRGMVPKILR